MSTPRYQATGTQALVGLVFAISIFVVVNLYNGTLM